MINKPNGTGINRVINATKCSIAGIRAAWVHEAAFRQEMSMCLVLTPLALWLANSALEALLMVIPLLLLLVVECINSALEATVDRIGIERHELSGRAKDLGSSAVFFTLLIGICCWAAVLLPRVW